jgi:hypothetical protein
LIWQADDRFSSAALPCCAPMVAMLTFDGEKVNVAPPSLEPTGPPSIPFIELGLVPPHPPTTPAPPATIPAHVTMLDHVFGLLLIRFLQDCADRSAIV